MINKDFIAKTRENNISHTDTDESMPAGSGGGTAIFNTAVLRLCRVSAVQPSMNYGDLKIRKQETRTDIRV